MSLAGMSITFCTCMRCANFSSLQFYGWNACRHALPQHGQSKRALGTGQAARLLQQLLALGRLHAPALREDHRQQVRLLRSQGAPDDGRVRAGRARGVYVVVLQGGAIKSTCATCLTPWLSFYSHANFLGSALSSGGLLVRAG